MPPKRSGCNLEMFLKPAWELTLLSQTPYLDGRGTPLHALLHNVSASLSKIPQVGESRVNTEKKKQKMG